MLDLFERREVYEGVFSRIGNVLREGTAKTEDVIAVARQADNYVWARSTSLFIAVTQSRSLMRELLDLLGRQADADDRTDQPKPLLGDGEDPPTKAHEPSTQDIDC